MCDSFDQALELHKTLVHFVTDPVCFGTRLKSKIVNLFFMQEFVVEINIRILIIRSGSLPPTPPHGPPPCEWISITINSYWYPLLCTCLSPTVKAPEATMLGSALMILYISESTRLLRMILVGESTRSLCTAGQSLYSNCLYTRRASLAVPVHL